MKVIGIILAAWFLLSIVVGIAVGKWIARGGVR